MFYLAVAGKDTRSRLNRVLPYEALMSLFIESRAPLKMDSHFSECTLNLTPFVRCLGGVLTLCVSSLFKLFSSCLSGPGMLLAARGVN
jgi:hypothetical protein